VLTRPRVSNISRARLTTWEDNITVDFIILHVIYLTYYACQSKGLPVTCHEGTGSGLEVLLHSFLTLALDGGWSPTLRPGHNNPGIDLQCPLYTRLNGLPRRSRRVWRTEKCLASAGYRTANLQSVASRYTDQHLPALSRSHACNKIHET
jgi:hypothetical protein